MIRHETKEPQIQSLEFGEISLRNDVKVRFHKL